MKREEIINKLCTDHGMKVSETGTLLVKGHEVSVGIPTGSYLLLSIASKPEHRLLVSPTSALTKELDVLGIGKRVSSGDKGFDQKYVVRADVEESMATATVKKIKQAIELLEPFVELEMTSRDYRLLKAPPQNIDDVVSDLEAFVHIVEATQKVETTVVS
jgi:uncharacterized lipoprotein YajG